MDYMQAEQIHAIRDYLAWSIVNLFCGWGIGGILPLVFSIFCRNEKFAGNYSSAKSMSNLALVFNILITVAGAIGWITFIIVMALFVAAASSVPHG